LSVPSRISCISVQTRFPDARLYFRRAVDFLRAVVFFAASALRGEVFFTTDLFRAPVFLRGVAFFAAEPLRAEVFFAADFLGLGVFFAADFLRLRVFFAAVFLGLGVFFAADFFRGELFLAVAVLPSVDVFREPVRAAIASSFRGGAGVVRFDTRERQESRGR
jgi:hypothetical protein